MKFKVLRLKFNEWSFKFKKQSLKFKKKFECKDQTTRIIFKLHSLKLKYEFLNLKEHFWTINFESKRLIFE